MSLAIASSIKFASTETCASEKEKVGRKFHRIYATLSKSSDCKSHNSQRWNESPTHLNLLSKMNAQLHFNNIGKHKGDTLVSYNVV